MSCVCYDRVSNLRAAFALLAFTAACLTSGVAAQEQVSFRREIAPILREHCAACHGTKKSQGSYRVASYAHAIEAGDSGLPGFAANELEGSESFRRMTSTDQDERMPKEGKPLTAEQLSLFERWLKQGAKYDAEDPHAPLVSIVPPVIHRDAPEKYRAAVPLTALAFTADGERILSGGYHEILAWNASDGKLEQRIGNVAQRTYALALKPDGAQWAVACGTPGRLGELRIFSADDFQLIAAITLADDVVFDAAWSPDGKRLAVASSDGSVRLFDTESWRQIRSLTSHSDWVYAVAWNSEGTHLASASRDRTAKTFLADSGEIITSYGEHETAVRGVVWQKDGKGVVSLDLEGKLRRWRPEDGKQMSETTLGKDSQRFAHTDDDLFVPAGDKKICRLKFADFTKVREFSTEKSAFLSVAVHPNSKQVAAGTADGRITVWNYEDGRKLAEFTAVPK